MDRVWDKVFEIFLFLLAYLITTDWARSYLGNQSISIKERRRNILIANYKAVKNRREVMRYRVAMYRSGMRSGKQTFMSTMPPYYGWAVGVFLVFFLVLFLEPILNWLFGSYYGVFRDFIFVYGYLILGCAYVLMLREGVRSFNSKHFEKYKRETILKYIKLGGRAQDFDKE